MCDTGGTFKSDTPGTFVSDIGGTFEVILSLKLFICLFTYYLAQKYKFNCTFFLSFAPLYFIRIKRMQVENLNLSI